MSSSRPESPGVQRRTPRAVGMESMLRATAGLLAERHPDEVTVRDVAAASGHHHRFVQSWFGGKVPLFRAAFDRLSAEVADGVASDLSGAALGPKALGLARLLNWLIAADPDAFSGRRPTPVSDRVTDAYVTQFGFDEELARLLAARTLAASISVLLFGSALDLDTDDVARIASLDREMVALLAERRHRP